MAALNGTWTFEKTGFVVQGQNQPVDLKGDLALVGVGIGRGICAQLGAGIEEVLVFGVVFVVAGLAFKLGAVPFHMWLPDVYHGAPTAVTLIIGGAPQLAAFAMTIRLLVEGLLPLAIDWQQMLALLRERWL